MWREAWFEDLEEFSFLNTAGSFFGVFIYISLQSLIKYLLP